MPTSRQQGFSTSYWKKYEGAKYLELYVDGSSTKGGSGLVLSLRHPMRKDKSTRLSCGSRPPTIVLSMRPSKQEYSCAVQLGLRRCMPSQINNWSSVSSTVTIKQRMNHYGLRALSTRGDRSLKAIQNHVVVIFRKRTDYRYNT